MPTSAKVIIFILAAAALLYGGFRYNKKIEQKTGEDSLAQQQQVEQEKQKIMEKLIIEDERPGSGAVAEKGNTVTVNYRGTFADGKQFDSSYDRGTPFSFVLGTGLVIEGWDQGVAGMKVGGKRNLTIPPELAYGPQGNSVIPPNSTLHFSIELLDVKK